MKSQRSESLAIAINKKIYQALAMFLFTGAVGLLIKAAL